MTIVVFSGPTLRRQEVQRHLDAVCLPPVAQGDVYRAMALQPRAIGIIDGFFHGVPAVWHKEILWALSQGVAVYGSASMGALRAAELHTMGMRGVGRIFEDYCRGNLEDDDEVAVVHGPAEVGYLALGEAMVNVRATLERAVMEGVLSQQDAIAYNNQAKAIFYQERTWDRILEASGLPSEPHDAFARWLETGRVDQKRLDAEAMLAEMKKHDDAGMLEPAADFDFETTLVWQRLVEDCAGSVSAVDRLVLNELGLLPDRYTSQRREAEARALALAEEPGEFPPPDRETVQKAVAHWREEMGLFKQSAYEEWLAANGLDAGGLTQQLADNLLVKQVVASQSEAIDRHLIALLQMSGQYQALRQRAEDKDGVIAAADIAGSEFDRIGVLPMQLAGWYFQDRLKQTMPENLAQHARAHGFGDLDAFITCLAREYLYLTSRKDG